MHSICLANKLYVQELIQQHAGHTPPSNLTDWHTLDLFYNYALNIIIHYLNVIFYGSVTIVADVFVNFYINVSLYLLL